MRLYKLQASRLFIFCLISLTSISCNTTFPPHRVLSVHDLIKREKVDVGRSVTSKFDLEDVKEAIEDSLQRDQVKAHV